jgi:voltage-gated potassium channel Kch
MADANSFAADLNHFALKLKTRSQAVFVNVVSATADSIINGSALTGSPGQPVDTGVLKASWITSFDTPSSAIIASGGAASAYNTIIEHNIRGATLRSAVGGFHSVALTVAGFDRIVASEVAKAKASV